MHPFGNLAIRTDGKEPINGWANSPRIEELRAQWLDTADLEQQKRIGLELQKQLWTDVPFIPMGEYWQATAYRKDLTDVLPGCFAVAPPDSASPKTSQNQTSPRPSQRAARNRPNAPSSPGVRTSDGRGDV